ncbi:uncharacterized protein LOC135110397 isoform X3 [Scylla paramamosain]|uniref:uncharacterized protein LOC135110397 isoform X3 n=1 Tax=Scylla paramamosain TaxID=85552 RepID=UPI00308313E5
MNLVDKSVGALVGQLQDYLVMSPGDCAAGERSRGDGGYDSQVKTEKGQVELQEARVNMQKVLKKVIFGITLGVVLLIVVLFIIFFITQDLFVDIIESNNFLASALTTTLFTNTEDTTT